MVDGETTLPGALWLGELTDDAATGAFLNTHRPWAAYALCDLALPFRRHARFIGARRDGQIGALLLIYAPREYTSIVPVGDEATLSAILEYMPTLPASAYLQARYPAMAAIERRYSVANRQSMLRMMLDTSLLVPRTGADAELRPLSVADIDALRDLYGLWPETAFAESMLECGTYHGAFIGGRLVAVAGTHGVSVAQRIAVLGDIFTHPGYRGLGLARAVIGSVVRALAECGIDDVCLNVRQDNEAARRIYAQLGFTVRGHFVEAELQRRE